MRYRPRFRNQALSVVAAITAGLGVLAAVAAPAHGAAASREVPAVAHGYPNPARAGFHDAALIYHDDPVDAASLARYIAYRPDGVTPLRSGWLFDAFVETASSAPSGTSTAYGPTTEADWLGMLDWWFGNGSTPGQLSQIDDAISSTASQNATDGKPMGEPPSDRKVIIAIPWPDPAQHNFGIVNGRPADLSVLADRVRVIGWYVQQIKERFAAAGYKHLQLWGVYFQREDAILSDQAWVRGATAQVHEQGLKALWIPYWSAPGWDTWRSLGFDTTILQPSAAFRGPMDGGDVSASRITSAAVEAGRHGLGVEIETRSGASTVRERAILDQYLAAGSDLGYQRGAQAWFLGLDPTPMTAGNAAYQDVARYILGQRVTDQDLHPNWTWTSRDEAVAGFPARSDLTALRVDLYETPGKPWLGEVTVQARTPGGWMPAGWALRTTQEPLDGRLQTITVPLTSQDNVTGLRVDFQTQTDSAAPLHVIAMTGDTAWVIGHANLAEGMHYTTTASAPGPAAYPDSSDATTTGFATGKLNDGTWSGNGWQTGKSVAWFATGGEVDVTFDLGSVKPVDKIVVYTHGGTYLGSNWPHQAGAILTTGCEIDSPSGRGAPPCAAQYAPATGPYVTGRTGPYDTDQSGYLVLTPPTGSRARWVTFSAIGNGWLPLDEIQIYSDGANIAPSATYHLDTYPTPVNAGYSDNGTRLTNSRIQTPFAPAMLTGWQQTQPQTITIDLDNQHQISSVVVWASQYASWGIVLPATVEVDISTDGTTWTPLGATSTADQSMPDAGAYTVSATAPVSARYVRVAIPAGTETWAWTMLSQIEVF